MDIASVWRRGKALSEQVSTLDSVEPMELMLRDLAAFFGGDNAQLCYRRTGTGSPPQTMRWSTYADHLSVFYMADHTFAEDPIVLHLNASTLPISSSQIDWTTPVASRLLNIRLALGVGPSELSGAWFGPRGEWCILSIFSAANSPPWDSWHDVAKPFLTLFLQQFYEKLRHLAPNAPIARSILSRREIECLLWAARGKSVADTAEIIGLAASSVRHILDGSRLKLSASSKSQAVAKAISLGLLSGV